MRVSVKGSWRLVPKNKAEIISRYKLDEVQMINNKYHVFIQRGNEK